MCAQNIEIGKKRAKLKDGTEVCEKCGERAKGRKTMTFDEYRRLCICNSNKVPQHVEIGGQRKWWTGIGVVDLGPAEGNEVLITP